MRKIGANSGLFLLATLVSNQLMTSLAKFRIIFCPDLRPDTYPRPFPDQLLTIQSLAEITGYIAHF